MPKEKYGKSKMETLKNVKNSDEAKRYRYFYAS